MKDSHRPLSQRTITIRPTKTERLYSLLLDRSWHATGELVTKIGHSFAVAKWRLVQLGYDITKRRNPDDKANCEYRLGRSKNPSGDHLDGFGKR